MCRTSYATTQERCLPCWTTRLKVRLILGPTALATPDAALPPLRVTQCCHRRCTVPHMTNTSPPPSRNLQ